MFGFIQMCAARTDPKQRQSERDEDFHTALHEVTHILGFSEMLFPFFRNSNLQPRTPRCPLSYSPKMPAESSYKGELFLWYTNPQPRPQGWVHPPGWCCASNTFGEPPFRCEAQETLYLIRFVLRRWLCGVRAAGAVAVLTGTEAGCSDEVVANVDSPPGLKIEGKVRKVVRTPTVVEMGTLHFGCDSFVGMDLEDDGGEGSAGSHWDLRVAMNEYMASRPMGLANVKSAFTLALLHDSGWYAANFAAADALRWGQSAGCGMLDSCRASPRGFCNLTSNPWQCAFDRSAVSDCYMGDNLMDGCSRARPGYMCRGADAAQERFGGSLPYCFDGAEKRRCMGTEEGNSSMCLQSTLFLENYERQPATAVVGCYRARCLPRPSPLLPPPCPGTILKSHLHTDFLQ